MQNKKRIPVRDNVAYTHWEMPDLTGVKRRIAQRLSELQQEEQADDELALEPIPPTPEELLELRESARQEGHAVGLEEGLASGQEEGRALGYQEGEKSGQEAGFQAGYQRGLDEAQQEVDQQLARLQSLIEQLQGPLAALDYEVENALLSLVDLVCRAILRREIKLERGFLGQVIQEAVAALPVGHQRLRIFINPEDLNLAEAACQDLLEDYRLVGDPEVTLGGVKIETLQSLVDSTLENRYKKIINKLLGSAYQTSSSNFDPLPDDVLSTPDAAPLDEAVFSEPKITPPEQPVEEEILEEEILEEALEDVHEDEPVAQVSLQRGKAPRHELPLDTSPKLDELEPLANEPNLAEEEALAEEEIEEDAFFDQAFDELEEKTAAEEQTLEPQENTEKVDEFLEEFSHASNKADLEQPDEEAALDEQADVIETSTNTEASARNEAPVSNEADNPPEEPAEKDWSPESVHDDRYLDLENVLENTWLDDFHEPASDEPLDKIEEDKGDSHG